jgi:hypothetical protein
MANLTDYEIHDIEEVKSKGQQVGEGVYHLGEVEFADIQFDQFVIDFKGTVWGNDWRDTQVTVSMTLGGGGNGRDHWGWPGEPFAQVFHGGVTSDGLFTYFLAKAGTSNIVGGVFRFIRRGEHGAIGRTWRRV